MHLHGLLAYFYSTLIGKRITGATIHTSVLNSMQKNAIVALV